MKLVYIKSNKTQKPIELIGVTDRGNPISFVVWKSKKDLIQYIKDTGDLGISNDGKKVIGLEDGGSEITIKKINL